MEEAVFEAQQGGGFCQVGCGSFPEEALCFIFPGVYAQVAYGLSGRGWGEEFFTEQYHAEAVLVHAGVHAVFHARRGFLQDVVFCGGGCVLVFGEDAGEGLFQFPGIIQEEDAPAS